MKRTPRRVFSTESSPQPRHDGVIFSIGGKYEPEPKGHQIDLGDIFLKQEIDRALARAATLSINPAGGVVTQAEALAWVELTEATFGLMRDLGQRVVESAPLKSHGRHATMSRGRHSAQAIHRRKALEDHGRQ